MNREEATFLIVRWWEIDLLRNVALTKYQRLFVISFDYHVKCCFRNSLDETEFIYPAWVSVKRASLTMVRTCFQKGKKVIAGYRVLKNPKRGWGSNRSANWTDDNVQPKARSFKRNCELFSWWYSELIWNDSSIEGVRYHTLQLYIL